MISQSLVSTNLLWIIGDIVEMGGQEWGLLYNPSSPLNANSWSRSHLLFIIGLITNYSFRGCDANKNKSLNSILDPSEPIYG